MTSTAVLLVQERHGREDRALIHALRMKAKALVADINRRRGEGHLFCSECLAAGFFALYERTKVGSRHDDEYKEIMWEAADVDGYARLIFKLREMKGECL